MPIITNISQQRRRKDRFSIYIDGAYRLSLAQNQLVDAGLRVGDELDEAEVTELARHSESGKALDRAYNYLAMRLHSRREMVQYFQRKQYDEELIDFLLQQLERQNLIDDERFAREWVESRQQLSPRSPIQLRSELREKGIASDVIEAVLAVPEVTDEVTTIVGLITSKRLRQRYTENQKLIRHLAGKGFSYTAIKTALERLAETAS